MRTLICLLLLSIVLRAEIPHLPPGFKPLFNGRNLRGWHISRTDHHGSTPHVAVQNGVLELSQSPYGQGGLLLTNKRYRNFALYLEVQATWGCNSGIFLRSTEGGSAYQIELDQGRGTGNLLGENMTVSLPAKADALSQVWRDGDWNSFLLTMTGSSPRISERVNGILMFDIQEPHNNKIANETDGMIALQTHWASTYEAAERTFNLPGSWKPAAAYRFRNIGVKVLRP